MLCVSVIVDQSGVVFSLFVVLRRKRRDWVWRDEVTNGKTHTEAI